MTGLQRAAVLVGQVRWVDRRQHNTWTGPRHFCTVCRSSIKPPFPPRAVTWPVVPTDGPAASALRG